jgi:hypothetical protein
MAISMTTSLDFFRIEKLYKKYNLLHPSVILNENKVQRNIFYLCTFCCSQNIEFFYAWGAWSPPHRHGGNIW